MMHFPRLPAGTPLALGLALAMGVPATHADALDDIGFRALQAQVGAGLARGLHITINQVEASTGTDINSPIYRADPAAPAFVGVTFVDRTGGPNPAFSGHASGVAATMVGEGQMASEVPTVNSYEANHWINAVLFNNGLNFARPASGTGTLANHSWVGNVATNQATDVLSRVDWLVDQQNFIQVVGALNAGNNLFAYGFNVIAVGATVAPVAETTSSIDGFYVPGRSVVHLTGPWPNVSGAVPLVTAAVALLEDSAPGFTLPAELVKALLMAGAERQTRNSTTGTIRAYVADTSNGLDHRYGAGQLNVLNSYRLYQAGEKTSVEDGGVAPASSGWHRDAAFGGSGGSNRTATYPLGTLTTTGRVMASLAWHPNIVDPSGVFAPTLSLNNLNLALIDTTGGGNVVVATSASTIENTENLWVKVQRERSYSLRVTTPDATNFSRDYAIAWRLEPDSDGDGLPDRFETGACPSVGDADSDDDGLSDGAEDADGNGQVNGTETNPCNADSDSDGLLDGTERGVATGVPDPDGAGPLLGTDADAFVPDTDPGTQTNPNAADSDADGSADGGEDANLNGAVDPGESNPNDPASRPVLKATRTVPLPLGAQLGLALLLARCGMRSQRG